jgi:hypothetical protein
MSKQDSNPNSNCYIYLCSSTLFFCMMTCLLALPVSEMTLAILYRNDIVCHTDLYINVFEWLIIKSSINILLLVSFFILFVLNSKETCCYSFLFVIYYIISVFNLGWLILGSILFWRDCYNLSPSSINILMWVSLIMGYINIYMYAVQKK